METDMKNIKDSCSYYINLLCEKFRNKGIAEKAHIDAQADIAVSSKRRARKGDDTIDPKSKKYKTSLYNGKLYTGSEDFARYYKDLRGPKSPDAASRDEEEYKKALENAQGQVKLQSKKEMRLAIRKLMGEKLREIGIIPIRPKKLMEAVGRGFPDAEAQGEVKVNRKGMPKGMLFAVMVIFVSLLLIVTSSVMVSRTESDISRLESKLEDLKEQEAKLSVDLEVKNNMIDIKEIAKGEYGMVSAEYVASRYISIDREDTIITDSSYSRESAIVRLFEALGLKKED